MLMLINNLFIALGIQEQSNFHYPTKCRCDYSDGKYGQLFFFFL